MSLSNPPKALLFDVFGTVVDWRVTVVRELSSKCHSTLSSATASLPSTVRLRASTMGLTDWADFAEEWRNTYKVFTSSHDPGGTFITVDEHYLSSLRELLKSRGLEGLWPEEDLQEISLMWHRLDAWPDSAVGLQHLNKVFTTCTLSNGNLSLLQELTTHAGLEFTHIFSAELFQAYKPQPKVYKEAAIRLGLAPEQCAMVAAHLYDLKAAKACGYQTVYVEREHEEGWSREEIDEAKRANYVDMWVTLDEAGFLTVAERFGIERERLPKSASF
ncbi:2-haloacid dehalogenase [Xylona heveae TC161]|uniref:2-haloacid dehalogenase n=1 Tax=Xylona heveae (strain CBS 132557 / TC161) TaxID=1328760 RepID=A0A165FVB5_XYLHT|nr:2-haloacid dehalogenase [Xylona heveae TC161]KZF21423.1 2-haloacid dehalogenase [Xylona heveae TC161]